MSFAKNEQKTPEYLKINPRGRVPALVVDGTIVENTAILDYVAAKYAPQLMPKDPATRAASPVRGCSPHPLLLPPPPAREPPPPPLGAEFKGLGRKTSTPL